MRWLRFLPLRRGKTAAQTADAQRAPGGALWAQGMLAECNKLGGWFDQNGIERRGPKMGEVRSVVGMKLGPENEGTTVYLQFGIYRGAYSAAYFRPINPRDEDPHAPAPIAPTDLDQLRTLKMEGVLCLS